MSAIREEVRAILREELAEIFADQDAIEMRNVTVESTDDLNAFVADLLNQVTEPQFVEKFQRGKLKFVLERNMTTRQDPAIPATTMLGALPNSVESPILEKNLITERDVLAVATKNLRISSTARITPLARDEARRRGIRIERVVR
ncbi:MAG: hypothetical protein OXE94_14180 [Aestuariivita sp.]|nr:hypothetical protein [Aestuariivita sp.]MCY4202318.1 hypothetical protein [Aestuariivita sp.]MCY4289927.1 hypothetical protein [Aestuariivita sp.]MCY4346762.1 hypothetical protein [Aestuariivita sp.]